MGVVSDEGAYGIAPGLVYSYPVRCKRGQWSIVQGGFGSCGSEGAVGAKTKFCGDWYWYLPVRSGVHPVHCKRGQWSIVQGGWWYRGSSGYYVWLCCS